LGFVFVLGQRRVVAPGPRLGAVGGGGYAFDALASASVSVQGPRAASLSMAGAGGVPGG